MPSSWSRAGGPGASIALLTAVLAVLLFAAPAARSVVVPAIPAGATGIALDQSVELSWQGVSGATGYAVYRGTTPTTITTQLTAPEGVPQTTFSDTTAANGTTYYYVVTAVAAGIESGDSAVVQTTPVARSCSSGNPVVLENCFPGTTPWNVRNTQQMSAGGIEGYATAQSVQKGGSIDLKINAANGASVHAEIYRSGYYAGAGARLFSIVRGLSGVTQPACVKPADNTGLVDCSNWSTTATITTTASWPSGIYLVRLVREDTGTDNQILFVVRDDARSSNLLYGAALSTYQAYNNYGGRSLYTWNSFGSNTVAGTPRAVKVSYDRPFEQPRSGTRDWYTRTDSAFVYWLEQEGYDVTYQSDTDLERNGASALGHKAYLLPAHDEYYSAAMRTALEQARDAGVGLFDSGSNAVYWKIRFESSPVSGGQDRVQVCYKTTESGGPDPSGIPTGTWRDPAGANRPENGLLGVMYVGDANNTYFPLVVSAAEGSDRVFRYSGLDLQAPGTSASTGQNLVGWEWDARVANGQEPPGVKTLASSPVAGNLIQGDGAFTTPGSTTVNATKYVAASGALVFAAGTNHWSRGLARNADGVGEPTARIQQVTTNVLADMSALPQTPATGIVLDGSAPTTPPPTGVAVASTGFDSVRLTWNAVAGATGYNVYRALTPRQGGLPLGARANGSPLSATTFTDTGLAPTTTYYYVVTAVAGGVQSNASAEVQTTTVAAAGQGTRINAGGPAYTSTSGAAFSADTAFTGGKTFSTTQAISGTNDPALYQNERWGQFSYAVPVPNGTYDVRFHLAELYYGTSVAGGPGKRIFGLDVLDTPLSPDLQNIDIYAAVGPRAALVKTVPDVAVTDGVLNIKSVYGSVDDPEVTAIEIIPKTAPPPPGPDTTPPTVAVTAPAADANVAGTVNVTATAADDVGVAGVQFTLDGSPLGAEDTTAPYSLSWSTTGAAAGAHVIGAIARDAAGNTTSAATANVTVDNVAPTVALADPGSPLRATVSLSATAADATSSVASVAFQRAPAGGTTWTTVATMTAPPYSASFNTTTVTDGAYDLRAVATDAAGNASAPSVVTQRQVDNTKPAVSITAPAAGTVSGTVTLTAGATDAGGVAGVQLRLDGADLGPEDTTAPYSASWDTTTATPGSHTLAAVARDAAGNVTTSASVAVTVDNGAPNVSVTAPLGGTSVSGNAVAVSAGATDDVGVAGVQFKLDGAVLGAEDTIAPYGVTWDTFAAANGLHTLTAVARDAAGHSTTSAAVTVTVNNVAPPPPPPPTGLVAAYSFDAGTGTTAADSSGNGNAGSLNAATTWSPAGKFGAAVSFNGTSSLVTVPDSNSLDLTNGMTLEAWVNPSALQPWMTVVMKEKTANLVYSLYANSSASTSNRPAADVFTTSDQQARGSSTLPLNTWSYLTTTYDGTTLRVFLNGTQVGTRTVSGAMAASTGALRIGGDTVFTGEWFKGSIDELRIYNRALSAAEISSDMAARVGP